VRVGVEACIGAGKEISDGNLYRWRLLAVPVKAQDRESVIALGRHPYLLDRAGSVNIGQDQCFARLDRDARPDLSADAERLFVRVFGGDLAPALSFSPRGIFGRTGTRFGVRKTREVAEMEAKSAKCSRHFFSFCLSLRGGVFRWYNWGRLIGERREERALFQQQRSDFSKWCAGQRPRVLYRNRSRTSPALSDSHCNRSGAKSCRRLVGATDTSPNDNQVPRRSRQEGTKRNLILRIRFQVGGAGLVVARCVNIDRVASKGDAITEWSRLNDVIGSDRAKSLDMAGFPDADLCRRIHAYCLAEPNRMFLQEPKNLDALAASDAFGTTQLVGIRPIQANYSRRIYDDDSRRGSFKKQHHIPRNVDFSSGPRCVPRAEETREAQSR
jgi:hypothetical protein